MTDVIRWVLDSSDFTPRANCGYGWTPGLRWLHAGSDILIGLAYVAIPVTLLFFVRRRGTPFSGLIWLFGAFILACGTGHLIEATMFETPVYRLSGVVKAATAAVSWVTVIALIPAAPRVIRAVETLTGRPLPDETQPREPGRERTKQYLVATLAAVLAVLVRAALDPLLHDAHVFILSLLAVVSVAWYGGLWPALACVVLNLVAVTYLFVEPRESVVVAHFRDQIAIGLFLFCGVGCALLGEAQRQARFRAERVYRSVLLKQTELEAEIARRERAEADLIRYADDLQRERVLLETLLKAAPVGFCFHDPDLRYVRVNDALAAINGLPAADHVGKTGAELFPELKDSLDPVLRRVLETGVPVVNREVTAEHPAGADRRHFLASYYPVDAADGTRLGVGVVVADMTDRKRAEQALRESEATLRAFYDNSPACMGVVEPTEDGDIRHVYDNPATCRFFGVPPGHTRDRRSSEIGAPPETISSWLARYRESERTGGPVRFDHRYETPDGPRWLAVTVCPLTAPFPRPRFCYLAEDVTDRRRAEDRVREEMAVTETLHRVGSALAAELDLGRIVQIVTDEATKLSDAQFGAFFYNVTDARGESYTLYTLSGVPREAFARFPMPRNTAIFEPTFQGRGVVRLDDVTRDPRFGRNAPHRGMPDGHLPVRSYLAVPVVSRSGGTIGGLFFGHPAPGLFTERHEQLVTGLAAQAAIAIDNARLYEATREREAEFRAMADNISQLAWMARPDGHLFWYNRRWYEYTGTTFEEMEGWGWEKVHDPVELKRMSVTWRAALAAGRPWEETFPIRRHDGAMRWHLTRAIPVRDDAGNIVRWFGTNTDITDQREAEQALRHSEGRFRLLAGAVPQIVWVTRPDGYHEYYNPRWYEYTGMTEAESIGYGWSIPLHPDDRERSKTRWKHSTDTGEPYEIEYRFRGRDGTYRWFLGRALPERDEAGAIVRWFGTCTDIDEFKRLREDLRTSERRFRSLTEETPQLVWTCRPDGACDYLSRQWVEYTGVPMDDQLGAGWLAALHPDDKLRAGECWRNAVAGRAPYDLEYRIRRHDGAYRWFKTRGRPVRDDDGRVTLWLGTCTDIDDVKRLQNELEQSLERFRVLTEAIPQVVWNAGQDGEITYFNTRWREYTGVPVEDARGSGWMAAVHPDDAGRVYAAWRATVTAQADGFTYELRLRRASDGRYRWFLAVAVPLRRADGTVDQWIGSMADIHDRKEQAVVLERMVAERTALLSAANAKLTEEVEERRKAEELVTATAAELSRSNGELEKFAYVASHDLQEPLRKIQAFGDRLASRFGGSLGDQGRDYLDRMQASATRMRQLINDLLAFSRVTSKTQPFAPVDLNRTAADAVDDLYDRVQATGGTVDVGPLPTIDADPTQMRQLVQNLIGNALKFHKPDEPPRVTVRGEVAEVRSGEAGQAREVLRLTVADNGIGFEEKYLDRIFQVFQRLHGRNEYEGTGVGLAICRKIVDRHGGEITAHSAPGRGATFVVTLPVRQPSRISS